MAETRSILFPFRAIRYQLDRSQDLSALISPPYDIISKEKQAELYARSEHNFIRVELNNAVGDNCYAQASETLARWLAEGVLARESDPACYLLEQEFEVNGRTWRRRGIFGLVRLPAEGERHVLSHEGTLAEPKADRLNLMRACRAMTSPIMLMFEDPAGELLQLLRRSDGEPDAVARDAEGGIVRLWVVRGAQAGAFSSAIGPGPLVIADGHHRFETAVSYRDEMRAAFPEARMNAGFNHALALVNSARDEGLRIFPTHRLVSGLSHPAKDNLWRCVREHFDLERLPASASHGALDLGWLDEQPTGRHIFGAYSGDSHLYRLSAKPEVLPRSSRIVDSLDVSVLHHLLIEPTLSGSGCPMDSDGRVSHDSHAAGPAARGARLAYTTDAAQAVAAVDRGDYHFAFFLRPTRVSEVLAAARAGERMPGKSTYFYPKVPAGLVVSDASEGTI